MQNQTNKGSQSNFLIAAVLSLIVLTGWMYFFAPQKPADESANANTNTNVSQDSNSNAESKPAPEVAKEEEKPDEEEAETPADDVPNKTITITTPLYKATFDSKGAVATSWILLLNDTQKKDDADRKLLYANGSTKDKKIPLELISQQGLKEEPRIAPFQLVTEDEGLNKSINQKNYSISVDDEEIVLSDEESKEIEFTFSGEDGVKVTKKFVFRADKYIADLSVNFTKDDKVVPNTKLLIGPSIGDQAIPRYNFYTVEPEGVYNVADSASRQYAASITEDNGKGQISLPGEVNWAGVGDTYFAMAAVPAQKTNGLEYRSSKFEQEVEPYFDGIIAWITRSKSSKTTKHLITAYVPINADGSTNKIYTGTKDYFVLHYYDDILSEQVGRTIDIDNFLNFGYLYFVTQPLSYPILTALKFLYGYVQNYGIAIIIFTFFFYSLLFPFRWFSSKSFKKAQKNAPKLQGIKDEMDELKQKGVSADDPKMRDLQMQQLKMMKGAVPIGGCFPMLLQFPLIIALYITVSLYLGFRQESFLWLPDLSAGDPYHILEFAFAISMILSFKFSPTTPAVTPEQKMQQNMMTYIMPIMMLWIMWSAPAGLLLYWFTGNIIMFAQQMIINYMNKTDEPPEEDEKESKPEILRKKPKLAKS